MDCIASVAAPRSSITGGGTGCPFLVTLGTCRRQNAGLDVMGGAALSVCAQKQMQFCLNVSPVFLDIAVYMVTHTHP